jgi:hypothetical protein
MGEKHEYEQEPISRCRDHEEGKTCSRPQAYVWSEPRFAPVSNAHAERFVRSIKEECLNRLIPLGERHFRRTLTEFVAHYYRERNHQGLGNELIDGVGVPHSAGRVLRRQRVGGIQLLLSCGIAFDDGTKCGQPNCRSTASVRSSRVPSARGESDAERLVGSIRRECLDVIAVPSPDRPELDGLH